ncbi:MAG: qheDH, partial [Gammaproteobacteria bacterium]|nr:qheDH [Gammaproteobacteria bacterium]
EPQNWLSHGRTYSEEHYSPLASINAVNVQQLGLAWYLDLPGRKGIEAIPLVVDGIMYTTGLWNEILALDAVSGNVLWRYDPHIDKTVARFGCCGAVNRGPAVWKGRIYTGLLDGRLLAVDAVTGKPVWEVQTTDPAQPYTITGAPRIINGKVIIGNGGAEFGVRGYVTAYDAETGAQVWRFYTVPGNPALGFESDAMAMAAKTWNGEWWLAGGGGTAWDSFAYDPELNLLYIGTGNGTPWVREIRSPGGGDNLFLSSIIAVNADTGAYVWHYQTTPGENWDFTATQPMILADLEIGGAMRKVLMQAPKNGFFYVLDRATGELLSAEKIVPINWASHVDMASGRPVEIEENLYTEEARLVTPGPHGAHDWQPMSYSPLTGLVYIPAHEMWWVYSRLADYRYQQGLMNHAQNPWAPAPPEASERLMNGKGYLLAWDPVKARSVWRIDGGRGWNGGVLTTAGNLLIQGHADGRLVIAAADSGKLLWELPIQTGAVAGPMTYAVAGEQYIAIAAGWAGAVNMMGGGMGEIHHTDSRILVFKLGGQASLPPPAAPEPMPEPPPLTASGETVALGARLYGPVCGSCHGFDVISGGSVKDLRYMQPATHAAFKDIVLGGIMQDIGMGSFANVFNDQQVEAIHAYIIKRAHDTYVKLGD